MLKIIPLLIVMLVLALSAAYGQASDGVIEQCPTLARLAAAGQLDQIRDPVFTDRAAAKRFASDCQKVAEELSRFEGLPPEYAELREQAALAAEFLTGDTYVLSTCKIRSVVTLREQVRIPPPEGFVYVKTYASESSAPPVVQEAFARMKRSDESQTQGVTLRGRYIALLHSELQNQSADTLAHELVHAYIGLASSGRLPTWFHEAAAVYFSLGRERKLYVKTADPNQAVDVRVPDDYKIDLHSFQYLEKKLGKEKLYEFIRRAVETGNPDVRSALGLKPQREEPAQSSGDLRRRVKLAFMIVGIIAVVVFIGWMLARREESW